MGFPSGLFSGFTLTASTLYLTILIHNHHRLHQATTLRQQSLLLNSIVDPSVLPMEEEVRYRVVRGGLTERLKDGWNADVEEGVKWVQAFRWGEFREAVEGRWRVWRREGERRG